MDALTQECVHLLGTRTERLEKTIHNIADELREVRELRQRVEMLEAKLEVQRIYGENS